MTLEELKQAETLSEELRKAQWLSRMSLAVGNTMANFHSAELVVKTGRGDVASKIELTPIELDFIRAERHRHVESLELKLRALGIDF